MTMKIRKDLKMKKNREEAAVSNEEVQPWHRLGGIEHICELRKSSQVLYAIFVTILRMIYANKKGRMEEGSTEDSALDRHRAQVGGPEA